MASLEQIIAALRIEGKDFARELSAEFANEMRAALANTLDAGETPEGQPWLPGKKSGARVYKNARARVTVSSESDGITVTVTGPEAWAQLGTSELPVRRMVPDLGAGTPKSVNDALTRAGTKVMGQRGWK